MATSTRSASAREEGHTREPLGNRADPGLHPHAGAAVGDRHDLRAHRPQRRVHLRDVGEHGVHRVAPPRRERRPPVARRVHGDDIGQLGHRELPRDAFARPHREPDDHRRARARPARRCPRRDRGSPGRRAGPRPGRGATVGAARRRRTRCPAATRAAPTSTSSARGENGCAPSCTQIVPSTRGPAWMPTASLRRTPRSACSSTRTTSSPVRSRSNTPHCRRWRR